jgi:hypothetical protein
MTKRTTPEQIAKELAAIYLRKKPDVSFDDDVPFESPP